jgi:hypothetical protein
VNSEFKRLSKQKLENPGEQFGSHRVNRGKRNVVLVVVLLILVAIRFFSDAATPKFLPGSDRKLAVVGPARFAEYCSRNYSGSVFHQTGEREDDLVCSDRSSPLWQTQPITPDQVCLFEYPDSTAARTKQTGNAENDWSCTLPTDR